MLLARQGSIQAEHLPDELMRKAIFEPEKFDPTQAVTTRLPLVPDRDDEMLVTSIRVTAPSLPPPSVTSLQEGASAQPTSLADLLAVIEQHDGALQQSADDEDTHGARLSRISARDEIVEGRRRGGMVEGFRWRRSRRTLPPVAKIVDRLRQWRKGTTVRYCGRTSNAKVNSSVRAV